MNKNNKNKDPNRNRNNGNSVKAEMEAEKRLREQRVKLDTLQAQVAQIAIGSFERTANHWITTAFEYQTKVDLLIIENLGKEGEGGARVQAVLERQLNTVDNMIDRTFKLLTRALTVADRANQRDTGFSDDTSISEDDDMLKAASS